MPVKKIFNLSEADTHAKLKETCEKYRAYVFPKVRLADVVPIENGGISSDLYRYALQAHFDFVVVSDEHDPLFAVEFDGPSHQSKKQIERDTKKDQICTFFDFPILRINARYLTEKYRTLDLLSWFVETWFWRKAFFLSQEAGNIPADELFDPMLISQLPRMKKPFPLWLSLDIREKLIKLEEAKIIKDYTATGEWIGTDNLGNYHGFIWIQVNEEKGVYTQSAIHSQKFPVVESDILHEILMFQLFDEVTLALKGIKEAVLIDEIRNRLLLFSKKYRIAEAMSSYLPHSSPK